MEEPTTVSFADPHEVAALVRLRPGGIIPGTRYRIRRWLGEGAMGVVYEAEHLDIGKRIAIKVLRSDPDLDGHHTLAFREEVRAIGSISSPYVVDVFDFEELADGRLLFAMELVEGRTLSSELRGGPLAVERFFGLFRQLCKALAAAHEANIVHGDIKPSNIMLVSEGGRDMIRVMDFGISALTAGALTDTVARAGTPGYMSPEQIQHIGCDGRSDLYSLGCTAYRALTGRLPFLGRTVDELLDQTLQRAPLPPNETGEGPRLPDALEAVIMRLLARDPNDRPDDCIEAEAQLCEAQLEAGVHTAWDDLPIPEVDDDRRRALSEAFGASMATQRRSPGWVIAAFVLAAILFGGLVWLFVRAGEPPPTSVVDDLVADARVAGSRALFVYPPPEAPKEPTAYTAVLELEAVEGELEEFADEAAAGLRVEFTSTLNRLGDLYWERKGGRPFATDYYAQALVFGPDDAHARERAGLSIPALDRLETRAREQSFRSAELRSVEPLRLLALPPSDERDDALLAIARDTIRGTLGRMALDDYLRASGLEVTRPESPDVPDTEDAEDAEDAESGAPIEDDLPAPSPDAGASGPTQATPDGRRDPASKARPKSEDEPTTRDPAASNALVIRARAAAKAGQTSDATALYHQAIAANDRNVLAQIGLADLYFDRKQYGESARHARRATRIAPENADYRVRLGDALFRLMRYADARQEYEHADRLGHAAAKARLKTVDSKLGLQ